jgi:hypothetical protein
MVFYHKLVANCLIKIEFQFTYYNEQYKMLISKLN